MHHNKHRRWISSFVVITLALTVVTPVLAEFLGPNRTRTVTDTVCKVVLQECKEVDGEWKYKTEDSWSCSLESKPWQVYSNVSRQCNDILHTPGYQYWTKEERETTETVTYPPATIVGSFQNCTHRNGWCITAPQLVLTGIEPVAGYNIIAIEGTLNGQTFACVNSSCSVPLVQGANDFTYWALSSFLDSSEKGSATAHVDTQLPNITSSITGTPGLNGWHKSVVTVNSSFADATSGITSITCTRDGTAPSSCNSFPVNGEGPHTIVLTAVDAAGHIRTVNQTISIDTRAPTLSASLNGTMGSNNWYTSAALNAIASDPAPGSGLYIFQYSLDGSSWIAFPASGTLSLTDGKHTIDLRAVDVAGQTVSSAKSFWLDSAAPTVNLDSSGTLGLNGWYITNPTLIASASDSTSGMDIFEYSLDNSGSTAYTTPLNLDDGVHNISLWAQDQAGLVTQLERTYQVDTRQPQIAGNLSGVPGSNGWFISDVTISASAYDPQPGSDVDAFTYTLNGSAETPYLGPLTLSDGQHTVHFNAQDKAGLSHSIQQTFNIDTTPPALGIDSTLPSWVRDTVTFNGTAGDSGSGLSGVEISLDGGQTWQAVAGADSWNFIWNTTAGPSGVHGINVRASDQAGLATPKTINVGVDNQSPAISLPDSWLQWDTVTLNIRDEHSGLSEARVEISDPKGRWPARVLHLDPGQFPMEFRWDRRFADDTVAESGTYDVRVFAVDHLGHATEKQASIHVLIDILPPGPTSTPQPSTPTQAISTLARTGTPAGSPTATSGYAVTGTASPTHSANTTPKATQTVTVLTFGTIQPPVQATHTPSITSTPRATPTQFTYVGWLESILEPEDEDTEQTTTQISSPPEPSTQPAAANNSILWGTAAAAAIGAATAYAQEEQRKRQEEHAKQKALEEAKEERREKMKERKIEKMEAKRAQEAAWEQARLEQNSTPIRADIKIARQEHEEGLLNSLKTSPPAKKSSSSTSASQDRRAERKDEAIQEEINSYTAKPQDWKADYDTYMAQKAAEEAAKKVQESSVSQPKKKSWTDKVWDFVDEHQKEIALGVGIVAGVAAIVLSGGLAIPALLAVAGATATAGVFVAGGTVALNAYYERPWHENLLRNVAIAGGAALLTSGGGFLLQSVLTGASSYCAIHQSTCARVEPVLNAVDKAEETWLKGKLFFQTLTGDQVGAAETAFELHSDYADGGMPGNAVAKKLGDQATYLSKNAVPLIKKFGFDVVPLLVKHGDEGLAFIQKYGLDAMTLLKKHGNDATDLVHLDPDVLAYVMREGDDAVAALSRWSAKDLQEHGVELALRAKKDAEVLADVKKLTSSGPIDPKKLTAEQKELIEAIAANSTQYADNGQVVLGKWVDYGSGFVETAQETGSVHYNPHPDMWTMMGKLGDNKQQEVAWLVNKQVIQNGIGKGLPFEYTLNGIPDKNIANEGQAIQAIFAGAKDDEILKLLKADKMPIRMKELQELKQAGYQITFDDVNNSFILNPK